MAKAKQKSANIYFYSGANSIAIDREVDALKAGFVKEGISEFDINIFYADETGFDEVAQTANTLPFSSQKRLIILKNAGAYQAKDKKKLAEYSKNPSPFTYLIVVNPERPNKSEAWFKTLTDNSDARIFWPYKKSDLTKLVYAECLKRKARINEDALHAFVELVGENTVDVGKEIESMISYSEGRGVITRDDVAAVMLSGDSNVYEWSAKVSDGKYKDALRMLLHISLNDPRSLNFMLYALSDRFIKFYKYNTLIQEGAASAQALKSLRVIPFLDPSFQYTAPKYNNKQLAQIINILADSDCSIKTGKLSPEIIMERIIVDITRIIKKG
ncbi:MAG: DNA polymerase III subunit delta [Elusimicrobiota bacterium]